MTVGSLQVLVEAASCSGDTGTKPTTSWEMELKNILADIVLFKAANDAEVCLLED